MNRPGISVCARTSVQSATLQPFEKAGRKDDFYCKRVKVFHLSFEILILVEIGAFQKPITV